MTFTQSSWSLSDLFPGINTPEIDLAFQGLANQAAEFEKFRVELKPDIPAEQFLNIVREAEKIMRAGYRIYGFAGLSFAANTQDQPTQALMGRVQQFFAELQNRMLFFSLWWKDLDDDNATRLMDDSGDYRYYLEEMRHYKPHTLSEPEEKIVNIKNVTGVEALTNLYDSITNRYTFKVEVDGEIKEMTRGELMSLVRQPDPNLRTRAYQELYRVYGNDGPILGQMYQTVVRDWRNENVSCASTPPRSLPATCQTIFPTMCRYPARSSTEKCADFPALFSKSRPNCLEWRSCAATTFTPPSANRRKPTISIPPPKWCWTHSRSFRPKSVN